MSTARTMRQLRNIQREQAPLGDRINTHLSRMIAIQVEQFPSHWTADERRDAATVALLGRVQ